MYTVTISKEIARLLAIDLYDLVIEEILAMREQYKTGIGTNEQCHEERRVA